MLYPSSEFQLFTLAANNTQVDLRLMHTLLFRTSEACLPALPVKLDPSSRFKSSMAEVYSIRVFRLEERQYLQLVRFSFLSSHL